MATALIESIETSLAEARRVEADLTAAQAQVVGIQEELAAAQARIAELEAQLEALQPAPEPEPEPTPEPQPEPTPEPEPEPPSVVFLSDLEPTEAINGWGPYERDRSNGEQAAGDGGPITLDGVVYAKGLGVHAASRLTYSLGGSYSRFQSDIGVDDSRGSSGSVVFIVQVDGVEVFRSGVITGASATQSLDIDVTGAGTLTLIVDPNGSANNDHANWADAKLISGSGPGPSPEGVLFVGGNNASDANPGTASAPFATIQAAANVATPGTEVRIRDGIYRETVVPAYSGTP